MHDHDVVYKDAMLHNLTSHHGFHPTNDLSVIVHHGDHEQARKEAHESLTGHGFTHFDTHSERHKGAPVYHVYRHNEIPGKWAVLKQSIHEGKPVTHLAVRNKVKANVEEVDANFHRERYPFHKSAYTQHHTKHFLEHPEVKKFGGVSQPTSHPSLTHLKKGEYSLHHSHSEGEHHVTFTHTAPNGKVTRGEGSHHNLGVALTKATKAFTHQK